MSTALHAKPVLLWLLGGSAAALLTVMVIWAVSTRDPETDRGTDSVRIDDESVTFTIDGDLRHHLRPGMLVPFDLRLSNPHDRTLLVSELQVSIESVRAPHATAALPCSVEDFTVEQVSPELEVAVDAATSSTLGELGIPATGWPRVGMLDSPSNQDGCKNATMTLRYSASGRFAS